MFEINIKHKKPDIKKLLDFGFVKNDDVFVYTEELAEVQMTAKVTVKKGKLFAELTDTVSGEEYVLHRVPSASGAFVGKVRECHEKLLDKIIEKCYNNDVFKALQSKEIIEYVREKYSSELEHLWEDTPENAVWRRMDNNKWYAALLTVKREKLGLVGEGTAEVINLKATPERVTELLNVKGVFPAYHMNKKHWYTVVLDGNLQTEFICSLIDESFECVKKYNKKRTGGI